MPAPLISIILPTYHWPQVLRFAIGTVLQQSFEDFELLVIGDACNDETESMVRAYSDPRIHWHNLPENIGNQAGPNAFGLSIARGKYVAYMHQDDLWLPAHLQLLVDAMEKEAPNLAHTLCLQISPTSDAGVMMRMVMGLPGTGQLGPERRAIYTPAFMHTAERARAIGGWGDWRALRKSVVADFVERMAGEEQNIYSIHEISVIKFNSAERRNSYLEKPCHEQREYLQRLEVEDDLLYRETLLALEHKLCGFEPVSVLAGAPANPPPGWEISMYRKMRGLPAAVPAANNESESPGELPDSDGAVFYWTALHHEEFRTIGIHDLERWNERAFRWSSPVCILEVPLESGEYSVGIQLLPLKEPQSIKVLINGGEVEPKIDNNAIRVTFRHELSGILQLTLIVSGWRAPGDARQLGVALSHIYCRATDG